MFKKQNQFRGLNGFTPFIFMSNIIAIASGKGGVGKSFLAANLAFAFRENKAKILLVDCDLGGANLHHFLGINPPEKTIYSYLRESTSFEDIIYHINDYIDFIAGTSDVLGMHHIQYFEKLRILNKMQNLLYDYIILDLGAGTSFNVLDFFNIASYKVLVVTSEQTSVENAYGFLKIAFLREAEKTFKNEVSLKNFCDNLKRKSGSLKNISILRKHLTDVSNSYEQKLDSLIGNYKIGIILNMIKKRNELNFFFLLDFIVNKYLGFHIEKLGFIPYDNFVGESLKTQKVYYSNASAIYRSCFDDLLNVIIRNIQSSEKKNGTAKYK